MTPDSHRLFLRDDPDLCTLIKRLKKRKTSVKTPVEVSSKEQWANDKKFLFSPEPEQTVRYGSQIESSSLANDPIGTLAKTSANTAVVNALAVCRQEDLNFLSTSRVNCQNNFDREDYREPIEGSQNHIIHSGRGSHFSFRVCGASVSTSPFSSRNSFLGESPLQGCSGHVKGRCSKGCCRKAFRLKQHDSEPCNYDGNSTGSTNSILRDTAFCHENVAWRKDNTSFPFNLVNAKSIKKVSRRVSASACPAASSSSPVFDSVGVSNEASLAYSAVIFSERHQKISTFLDQTCNRSPQEHDENSDNESIETIERLPDEIPL